MKKRIMSLLLAVLMVMSLFSGLSTSAHAATVNGANVIEYTMENGDYVLRICQKLGLNYYTCKPAIMALNNINDSQWSKLAVGRKLIMPASDQDAILYINGASLTNTTSTGGATVITGTATTGTATAITTGTTVTTTNTAAVQTADVLAYYLVPYTMSLGETVSGVCNNLGVNFSVFHSFIQQVNDISSWNKVRAGQTLIIPTPVRPTVGTTCYGVMLHKVVSNDTAYSITNKAGINYNANLKLLEALNQTNNLGAIKAGDNFFYPVSMTVAVPGTGNAGSTATTTTTTTVTDGNGSTTTTTTSTAKLYKLTSNMSSSDGQMLFYVNNQVVTAAAAGAKVTVVTDTAPGKAIQGLTVKHSDGKADVNLTADAFIMPSCDVRVDATIKTGYDINIEANYSGKASATVGGISVQSAIKGAAVVIKSADPNYEIQSIYAYYRKLVSTSTKTPITVSSSNAFIMPDADVYVEVVLKPVSTYAFYVNDPANGSFYLQVNGSPVTRAAKGATVTVVAQAKDGYEPTSLTVFKHGSTTEKVNVFSNTFTMPAFDVDVTVEFGAKGNNILIMPSQFATVYAFKNMTDPLSEAITDRESGQTVYLKLYDDNDAVISSGYNVEYDVVRNSDGLKVKVKNEGSLIYSFEMPKGGVTVTPVITSLDSNDIISKFFVNSEEIPAGVYKDCSFSITWNGKISEFTKSGEKVSATKQIKSKIPAGEYIDLRFDCSEGMAFVKYRIIDNATLKPMEEETNAANLHGYFQMPDTEITIEAYFESGKAPIGYFALMSGNGTVSYRDKDGKSINSANPGDIVTLIVTPANGYKFDYTKYADKLIVSRKDNGAPLTITPVNGLDKDGNPTTVLADMVYCEYTFVMPAEGANVQVYFDAKPFVITMKCVDEVGNILTGEALWQIAVNGVPGVVDNGETKVDVAYGDYIIVAMTEAGWSKYNMVSFRIDGNEYTADVLNYFYEFQMIERWAKDLQIVAVMRPSTPYGVSIHSLSAYYDSTKGGVEFMILESPTGYSNDYRMNKDTGALNYVKKAVAGDKVAIVANSVDSKYVVKKENVSIIPWYTDADRIVPEEGWIDAFGNFVSSTAPGAVHVFYFTMPDSDMRITVNFSGTQQMIYIDVYDMDNVPLKGMIKLYANDTYYDVATPASFANIGYKTSVQVMRSELAVAENKKIAEVEVYTLDGPVSYYDLTGYYSGIWFNMPDQSVWVIVRMDDINYYNVTYVYDQVYNGRLVFRKTSDPTAPTYDLTDFEVGDTVYVFDVPDAGYKHLGLGELKIMQNGVTNLATLEEIMSPHVWKFTLPSGMLSFQANFQPEEAEIVNLTVNATGATPSVVDVTVNGNTTKITNTGTVSVLEGQLVTVSSATDGYEITTMSSGSGKGVSGTTYLVPDDLATLADSLNVTLASVGYPITWDVTGEGTLSITDGVNSIVSANAGAPVVISAAPAAGYKWAAGYPKFIRTDDLSEVSYTGSSPWTIAMPASGLYVQAVFEADTSAAVTFENITGIAGAQATLAVPGGTMTLDDGIISGPWSLTTGTEVTIVPVAPYDTVRVTDGTFDKSGSYVTYPVTGSATVYIKLSSSTKAVTLNVTSSASYGSISLTHANSKAVAEPASAFKAGEDFYFFTSPTTGYGLSGLKIVENISGIEHTIKAGDIEYDMTTGCYKINGISGVGIPEGGITITASFAPKTISLKFLKEGVGQVQVSNGTNSYTVVVDGSADVSVEFTFGDTITLTPVGGYSWAGAGVEGVTVTSGFSNTKSFKISSEGPYDLKLLMA